MRPPQYVNGPDGEPVAVVLDIHTYRELMEELEHADAVRDYDAAVIENAGSEMLSLDELTAMMNGSM